MDEDAYVVRVAGELDLANCSSFDRELRDAEASDAATILLDIDGLVFIDSAGLAMIRRAESRSRSGGNRLRITRGRGHVADLFRLTALDQTLPFVGGR
jgi:anti-anti-sigma factor